ncbi:phosphocholine cytidylyltransferase family protein [Desulfomarina sp.]
MQQTKKKRTGVVLAAGLGSRLVNKSYGSKPLVPVQGISLLLRTLKNLELACHRAIIVLGFEGETIHSYIKQHYTGTMELKFAFNRDYVLANGVSVLAAKEYLDSDFILTMADHIMEAGLLELALNHIPPVGGATLLVDYKLDTIFDMADATKVLERKGQIRSIGKELDIFNCVDTGLFVCTPGLLSALESIYQIKGDVSLSEGVQQLCENNLMNSLDIGDGFWQDVDTEDMLKYAEEQLVRRRRKTIAA